ncbi:S49 family peptidase [Marinobacter sp. P4B1]|uniref:S49 family peptidase n=1 Tax=Marinobacter sp. P4B1 TaxID=1119533 RepID=UPI00071D99C5|nr:S49 family peptidase [Marinobacter sp. P4B1]KRW83717.1 hypothetical protein AQ621_16845 [Marinobacter sp. P4B1]
MSENTELAIAIKSIAGDYLAEKKRERRWKMVRNILVAVVIIVLYNASFMSISAARDGKPDTTAMGEPFVSMVVLEGQIGKGRDYLSDANTRGLLEKAFEAESEGVIIYLSSPGGSPVQSELIRDRIKRLKEETGKPTLVVAEEILASGGYMIATAGDEIYVQPSTVVGSIGVIMASFGATELMEKVGVERRLYTAGENKGFTDPFSPQSEAVKDHIETMLQDIHSRFVAMVKDSRNDKISGEENLFDGRVWTGSQSVELGLADGIGSVEQVAMEVFGTDNLKKFAKEPSILDRLGLSVQAFAEAFASTNQNRVQAIW